MGGAAAAIQVHWWRARLFDCVTKHVLQAYATELAQAALADELEAILQKILCEEASLDDAGARVAFVEQSLCLLSLLTLGKSARALSAASQCPHNPATYTGDKLAYYRPAYSLPKSN